jgi:hypothetical protein
LTQELHLHIQEAGAEAEWVTTTVVDLWRPPCQFLSFAVVIVVTVLNCYARAFHSFYDHDIRLATRKIPRAVRAAILVQIRRNLEFEECAAKFASSGLKQLH